MKVMTILGTRPEIIFKELELRLPDYMLDCKSDSLMGQIGIILTECERVIMLEKPDRVLILGDTNSALSSIVAKRMGIPVFHMEAGNRCYDDKVPEEVNRRIIDHSRINLLREGIHGERICVTGNPILEVLEYYADNIAKSHVLDKLGLEKDGYFLVTLHRSENVDIEARLNKFIDAFYRLYAEHGMPVICSLHPRTRSQLKKQNKAIEEKGVVAIEPLGLFDFVTLEKNALCVLSDSGTVQEECCIFRIANVTLRDVTERPETVEAGSNMLSGADPKSILNCVNVVLQQPRNWSLPTEYLVKNVSSTIAKVTLGHLWR